MRQPASRAPALWESVAAGAAAGLAASWAMSRFMDWMMQAAPETVKEAIRRSQPETPPTVQTAQAVAAPVLRRELSQAEKRAAEPVVHYAFGALVGAVYGATGALMPAIRSALGLPYGLAVWLLADEVALPKLGLTSPPADQPAEAQAGALAGHLVYGAALWASTAAFEALLAGL